MTGPASDVRSFRRALPPWAIAALLAHGKTPRAAVEAAQRYTFEALRRGFRPGGGQHIPHRFFHLPETHKL